MPEVRPTATFIPGGHTQAGWDIDGDGKADVGLPHGPHYEDAHAHSGFGGYQRSRGPQEIRQLNQYQGFFTTPEGDFPVSVVANSMKEAAKILTMPGVFGDDVSEPVIIKFVKGKVAVSVPVHHVGFNTVIQPEGAIQSGAYATPTHAEVHNGTEVIFTAYEPFGWKFLGWYKGELCLSTEKTAYLDVYDPYSTLITYVAQYEFDPSLRNGRYTTMGKNIYFDFKFDGWGNFDGRLVINGEVTGDWFFIMPKNSLDADGKRVIKVQTDASITQPGDYGATFLYEPTPIGINLYVENVTEDNPWGFVAESVLFLKWESEVGRA
jgi:hypothetical protein